MKLLCLLSVTFSFACATVVEYDSEGNRVVKLTELDVKIRALMAAEDPSEEQDWSRFACQVEYCHCENKNGCRRKCEEYTELKLVHDEVEDIKDAGTDEQSCVTGCTPMLKNGTASVEVCKALCAIDYSLSPDRKQWEKEKRQSILTSDRSKA